jgi:hypothetical protein
MFGGNLALVCKDIFSFRFQIPGTDRLGGRGKFFSFRRVRLDTCNRLEKPCLSG